MYQSILCLVAAAHTSLIGLVERARRADRGQSTVEYALLLFGVGLIAVFAFKWLKDSGLLEKLFDNIINKVIGRATAE